MLRNESTYKLPLNKNTYRAIKMQTGTNLDVEKYINDCINEYKDSGSGLFSAEDGMFWSESFLRRMQKYETLKDKRRQAANARWNKENEEATKTENAKKCKSIKGFCKSNASVYKKVCKSNAKFKKLYAKKCKLNEIKLNEIKLNKNNIIKTKLNKTKLNNLFIYMINGQKNMNDENISEVDRQAIILCLKRLELYIQNISQLEYFPENKIFEYQLQYWAIKELHFSPYKVYLNTITRDKFLLKFLQTQKYITLDSEEKISDFISYFIKSLREDLKK